MVQAQDRQVREEPAASSTEPAPLDSLYRRYSAWLRARLRRRYGRGLGDACEDLVQETYLRAAGVQRSQTIHHPQALLWKIATRLVLDAARRRSAAPHDVEGDVDRLVTAAEQDDLLALKQVVLSLPRADLDVFLLSRVSGLTYDEIARELGISVKTVEWRMSRALAHCARILRA